MLPEEKQIVIAGAGFAGIRAALDLVKEVPNCQITLIDSAASHCFHADLYEVGTAVLKHELKKDFSSLEGTVNIPLTTIFKNKKVSILVDQIEKIDLEKREIKGVKNTITFDFLILSLGSTTNYFGISGAQEYSHSFKCVEDALNVRDDIEELVFHSDHQVQIAIAGGGFTGVELAGELVGYVKSLAKLNKKPVAQITILEASPTVLPGMPEWAEEKAATRLKKLGVKLHLSTPITKVNNHEIFSENQPLLSYDYLIWTTGVKGASLDGNIVGVEITKRGKLVTEADLSLKKYPNVFVIGDLAECMDMKRNCPMEATAWMGIAEGEWAAKNLAARLKGEPTTNFSNPSPTFVVPIGQKYAIADLGKIKLTGFLAWLLKRLITLRYLFSILPIWQATSIWLGGVKLYSQND